jgi:serine/threonine protein kinase
VKCSVCGAELTVEKSLPNLELLEIVGEGGMGTVYRARDLSLQREVAVKLLNRDFSREDQKNIDAMLMEARVMASISHQNIVKVFSCNYENEQFYIVMEYLPEGSLDDLMENRGRIPEAQVLQVGIDIANGLKAAHEAGLVHRDVKPGNILFTTNGMSKIVDFGLARPADQRDQEELEAEIWGTPYYVPPETLNREAEDFRSDIYSLGATLFHALAGRPPFEAENASLVAIKHLKSQAVSLKAFAPDAADETAYVINRMLHKEPDERFNDYDELIDHFEYALEKVAAGPRKNVFQEHAKIENQKTSQLFGLITLLIMALLIAVGATMFLLRDQLFGPRIDPDSPEGRLIAAREVMLINGNEEEALDLYQEISRNYGEMEENRFWADYNRALLRMLEGDITGAESALNAMANVNVRQLAYPMDLELINFFSQTGSVFNNNRVIPVRIARQFKLNGVEALSYLLFGLKDFYMSDYEAALEILRDFQEANPPRRFRFIEDYKPLAEAYLHDARLYRDVITTRETRGAAAALQKLREVRPQVKVEEQVLPDLLKLEAELEEQS